MAKKPASDDQNPTPTYHLHNAKPKTQLYTIITGGTIIDGHMCAAGEKVNLTEEDANAHRSRGVGLKDVQ